MFVPVTSEQFDIFVESCTLSHLDQFFISIIYGFVELYALIGNSITSSYLQLLVLHLIHFSNTSISFP